MTRFAVLFALAFALSGCLDGTNPFMEEDTSTTTTDNTTTDDTDASTTDNTGTPTTETTTEAPTTPAVEEVETITSNRTVLPGTVNPSPGFTIVRREARGEPNTDTGGNGYAEGFTYDGDTDTFIVDNLAFDGVGGYTMIRTAAGPNAQSLGPFTDDGAPLGLGPFLVFENEATAVDTLTLASVDQLRHRALYAIGPEGDTSIAIVRTGAYIQYGFGGYIYQREGGVTLPTAGQAVYRAVDPNVPNYAGLRDFNRQGGLEYVTGQAEIIIDFDDFNEGAAVQGNITDRKVYALDSTKVTQDIIDAYNESGTSITEIPALQFIIEPGVLDNNGELKGTVAARLPSLEAGEYFAILSGEDARTIIGIVVVTTDDPRDTIVDEVRETGGFFAVRQIP